MHFIGDPGQQYSDNSNAAKEDILLTESTCALLDNNIGAEVGLL